MIQSNDDREYVISVIQGDDKTQRMIFASRSSNSQRPIILRRESFSPDVGWFTQDTIAMTRQEMAMLRSAMGGQKPAACQATALRLEPECRQPTLLRLHNVSVAS